MELCSLEDDDYCGLFITQSDPVVQNSSDGVKILPEGNDFESPCISLVSQVSGQKPIYEDISDDEIFNIPSSQVPKQTERYVYFVGIVDFDIYMMHGWQEKSVKFIISC